MAQRAKERGRVAAKQNEISLVLQTVHDARPAP